MAEPVVLSTGVCSNFEPQRWRRKKCKICFHDVFRHSGRDVPRTNTTGDYHSEKHTEKENFASFSDNIVKPTYNVLVEGNLDTNGSTPTIAANLVDEEIKLVLHSDGQIEANVTNGDDEHAVQKHGQNSMQDSLERRFSFGDDEKIKKEGRGQLSRLSTVDRSSNSSLASFDALEWGSSSYPSYGGSRETLDSISLNCADLVEDTSRERENKVIHLEQEIERLKDIHRAEEASKERKIQILERETQNLKLEIANFTARENVSVLKSRLELESKCLKIYDLENELRHLNDTIEKMTVNKHSEEYDQDNLQRELTRSKNKIITLEEEKKTLEERLTLAEDLQKNDRELLEVLRDQLIALEKDLSFCQEKTKSLEEKNKILEKCELDLIEERVKNAMLLKQLDSLKNKLHQRDKQVNDLEDDNVRLQQLNMDYRKEINRDLEIIEKLEGKLLLCKKEFDECNREMIKLSTEKKRLPEKRPNHEMPNDLPLMPDSQLSHVIELESKLSESEREVQNLQLENDQLIREIGDLLENLSSINNELEECKESVLKSERDLESFRRSRRDNERKIHSLQKKLNRVDREKKKYLQEKLLGDEKITLLEAELEKTTSECDKNEKNKKMLTLKLQSTEAKLAMLEGDKVYVESKLNNYRCKIKQQASVINRFGLAVDMENDEDLLRDLKEQNILYKSQIQVGEQLTKESDKIIEKLQIQNKDYSVSLHAMEQEVMTLKEQLAKAQGLNDKLKHQLLVYAEVIAYTKHCLERNLQLESIDTSAYSSSIYSGEFYKNISGICDYLRAQMMDFDLNLKFTEESTESLNSQSKRAKLSHSSDAVHKHLSNECTLKTSTNKALECVINQQDKPEQSLRDNVDDIKTMDFTMTSCLHMDNINDSGCNSLDRKTSRQTLTSRLPLTLARPKKLYQRSVSAPELPIQEEERCTGIGKKVAKEPLPVTKVITTAYHLSPDTRRRVITSDLRGGHSRLSKTTSENTLLCDHSGNEGVQENRRGKFIVQANANGVQIQEKQHGSVIVRIKTSDTSNA